MRVSIASFAFAWLVTSVAASPVVDISATEAASPLEERDCSKAGASVEARSPPALSLFIVVLAILANFGGALLEFVQRGSMLEIGWFLSKFEVMRCSYTVHLQVIDDSDEV
ncbi:unnamed protein product [Clonostachys solani]|uniref:Secreted protein n=1 Tax=Clonostachys solani TaxID=160281 RepID=A0A9N9Z2L5_9HYPO|nr:unnamed protein product [Clonostachys solani]